MNNIFLPVNEMTCLQLVFVLFVLFACSVIHPNIHFLQVKSPGLLFKPFFLIPGMFLFEEIQSQAKEYTGSNCLTLGGLYSLVEA